MQQVSVINVILTIQNNVKLEDLQPQQIQVILSMKELQNLVEAQQKYVIKHV